MFTSFLFFYNPCFLAYLSRDARTLGMSLTVHTYMTCTSFYILYIHPLHPPTAVQCIHVHFGPFCFYYAIPPHTHTHTSFCTLSFTYPVPGTMKQRYEPTHTHTGTIQQNVPHLYRSRIGRSHVFQVVEIFRGSCHGPTPKKCHQPTKHV